MRLGLGIGTGMIVAVLLSAAAYLFGLVKSPSYTVSLALLLIGLWTIACALTIVERKDRNYYGGWGVVIAVLSLFAFLPLQYAIGLLLLALVALILLYAYTGRTDKIIAAARTPPAPAGGTPAATAI
jgi:hypothetical protein